MCGRQGAFGAELILEVVALKYRTAEQVLPVLQPLVPKPGTVSGLAGKLIIRTTPAVLAEVRRVLDAIDRLPRRLMLTVRQDAHAQSDEVGAGVSGTVARGDARVTVPPPHTDDQGVTIQSTRAGARVQARVYGTQSIDTDRNTQQVQVLEGNEAIIYVGQSVPVATRSVVTSGIGGRVVERHTDAVDYRDALTGFRVRPRLAGDVVMVEIEPQRDTLGAHGPGSIAVQRVSTTVSGRLGEWIDAGGIIAGRSLRQSGTVFRSDSVRSDDRRVLIRVDEIP